MRFLADENIPNVIIRWLQAEGHDVLMATALAAGASDRHWLDLAEAEKRIIITSDKDFGELVFRDRRNS
jgi:predicted nuclease of predicted toxin-antitoxin system